jgi:hypothetical protein
MNRLLLGAVAFVATFTLTAATEPVVNRIYLRFDNIGFVSMTRAPDGHGGLTSFRSRDGVYVVSEHFDFPSHEAANIAFVNVVRGAERTLRREVLYDRERNIVTGQRVVIEFGVESGIYGAAVVSVDDTRLDEVFSTSLLHTLALERGHHRY